MASRGQTPVGRHLTPLAKKTPEVHHLDDVVQNRRRGHVWTGTLSDEGHGMAVGGCHAQTVGDAVYIGERMTVVEKSGAYPGAAGWPIAQRGSSWATAISWCYRLPAPSCQNLSTL